VSVDEWEAVGKVCAAILALAGVLLLVAKGLGTLWQWKFGNEIKAALQRIEEKIDTHTHDDGGWPSMPVRPIRPKPNGARPRRSARTGRERTDDEGA
jgi:hypothetical protein